MVRIISEVSDGHRLLEVKEPNGGGFLKGIHLDSDEILPEGRYLVAVRRLDDPARDLLPTEAVARKQTPTARYEAVPASGPVTDSKRVEQAVFSNAVLELIEGLFRDRVPEMGSVEVYIVDVH